VVKEGEKRCSVVLFLVGATYICVVFCTFCTSPSDFVFAFILKDEEEWMAATLPSPPGKVLIFILFFTGFITFVSGGFVILRIFCFCEGGGYCCVFGSGICLLCIFCSFCWEEDLSVCCHGPLHTTGNPILNLHLLYAHFTVYEWVGGRCDEICDCCFLIQGFDFMCP